VHLPRIFTGDGPVAIKVASLRRGRCHHLTTSDPARLDFLFFVFGWRGGGKHNYSTGSSNCAHHFGLKRGATFGEQLILHDCVSHGSLPLLLTVASGAAAALAAGEDNEGAPGVGAVCGATATGRGSFFDKSPVAHPVSAKTSKAAACLMIPYLIIFFGFLCEGTAGVLENLPNVPFG